MAAGARQAEIKKALSEGVRALQTRGELVTVGDRLILAPLPPEGGGG